MILFILLNKTIKAQEQLICILFVLKEIDNSSSPGQFVLIAEFNRYGNTLPPALDPPRAWKAFTQLNVFTWSSSRLLNCNCGVAGMV